MARYSLERQHIRSGDLLAWSHRSWKNVYDMQVQAVRFFTMSEYCHVGVAWVQGSRVFVIESVTPKIRIYPLSHLLPFYMVKMEAPWFVDTEEYALSIIGGEYSKWECVKSYFDGDSPDDNQRWQCAKAVRSILLRDGIDLGPNATPSAIVHSALELKGNLSYVTADPIPVTAG